MEYNPFTQEYNRLRTIVGRKNNEKSILVDELRWFDGADISNLFSSLDDKEASKSNYESLIDRVGKEKARLNINIQEARKKIKTLFNPFNWFDDDQIKYREELDKLRRALSAKHECWKKTLTQLSDVDSLINKMKSDIDRYKKFNRQKVSDELDALEGEIELLKVDYKRIADLKNNVDAALTPIMKQIARYVSSISGEKTIIGKAQSFEKELDNADNSYERAMIHEKCEKSLGEGSPKKIIRQKERTIRRIERDLEKARKRASQIGKKASRDIRSIIIDGNNMCYEGGKFVGLEPLLKTTLELQKQYKVTVVFDSAIRSQIQANDHSIRSKFDKNVEVHVVATKQLADETILDVASNNDLCYILSNDRFGEYKEKEVVRNNRLIRHEIVSGKVIIHDLDINSKYG